MSFSIASADQGSGLSSLFHCVFGGGLNFFWIAVIMVLIAFFGWIPQKIAAIVSDRQEDLDSLIRIRRYCTAFPAVLCLLGFFPMKALYGSVKNMEGGMFIFFVVLLCLFEGACQFNSELTKRILLRRQNEPYTRPGKRVVQSWVALAGAVIIAGGMVYALSRFLFVTYRGGGLIIAGIRRSWDFSFLLTGVVIIAILLWIAFFRKNRYEYGDPASMGNGAGSSADDEDDDGDNGDDEDAFRTDTADASTDGSYGTPGGDGTVSRTTTTHYSVDADGHTSSWTRTETTDGSGRTAAQSFEGSDSAEGLPDMPDIDGQDADAGAQGDGDYQQYSHQAGNDFKR
ncbi:hypothetical protein [Scardovia wiggsiae]|uniref:hypothetical protein n=1 Tax=Scardovia wiggsiae TaxID=230143 RepID=UPI00374F64E5